MEGTTPSPSENQEEASGGQGHGPCTRSLIGSTSHLPKATVCLASLNVTGQSTKDHHIGWRV